MFYLVIQLLFLRLLIVNYIEFWFSAKAGVCRPPLFNEKASVTSDCLKCYCFGVTETCYSSSLFVINVSRKYSILVKFFTFAMYKTRDEFYLCLVYINIFKYIARNCEYFFN